MEICFLILKARALHGDAGAVDLEKEVDQEDQPAIKIMLAAMIMMQPSVKIALSMQKRSRPS